MIPEKPPSPTPLIQDALNEARKQAHENRLEDKDIDELNDLEDEEDEAFLQKYRWVLTQPWKTRVLIVLPKGISEWQNCPL